MSQDKIGKDEWVSRYQERIVALSGVRGIINQLSERLSIWGWLVVLAVVTLPIPLLTTNNFIIRIGANIALMATLGIGLNLVVGYAGLLDLGFVAFYGIGAYAYAFLSSDFSGLHWDTGIALIFITVISALFGLLLGLPSLRLIGDYLAIVTLGFGQMFVQLTTSMTRVQLPWLEKPVNLTGGPNGIPNLDPINILGFKATTPTHYYYLLLVTLGITLVIAYHLNKSRLGRAWRAQREDELAAEAMGIPTRRLKLMAFAMGAAIAGWSGAMFAAFQGSVFPGNFDITLLITIYAIIVLGGLGSLPGVLVGALVMMAIPDILRIPALASFLFYAGVFFTLVTALKPRWRTLAVLAGVIVLGIVLKLVFPTIEGSTLPSTNSAIINAIRGWLVAPKDPTLVGNWAFGGLIVMVLLVTRLKPLIWRFAMLIPTLYMLAFVWETRLSEEPSVTRLIFVGVLLITLMIYRPNGLLGQRRVEVV